MASRDLPLLTSWFLATRPIPIVASIADESSARAKMTRMHLEPVGFVVIRALAFPATIAYNRNQENLKASPLWLMSSFSRAFRIALRGCKTNL